MERMEDESGHTVTIQLYTCLLGGQLPDGRLMSDKDFHKSLLKIATRDVSFKLNSRSDDYPYELKIALSTAHKDLDNALTRTYEYSVFFKTELDRDNVEEIYSERMHSWNDFDVLKADKKFDERMFELCNLLPDPWFKDTDNVKGLAGMLHRSVSQSSFQAQATFLAVLFLKQGSHFNYEQAAKIFINDGRWNTELDEAKLKSIVGGANTDGYRTWKSKGSESGERINPKELKSAFLEDLAKAVGKIAGSVIHENNEWNADTIQETAQWIGVDKLAHAIKSSYAYINNGGSAFWLKKRVEEKSYSENDWVSFVSYKQSSVKSRDSSDDYIPFCVKYMNDTVVVTLKDILKHCAKALYYAKADAVPFSPMTKYQKTGTFNLFDDYQHVYDPDLVLDMDLVNMWVNHIQAIICCGDERTSTYLLNWFAHILQFPGTKTKTVPLLKSKPGAGKNFIFNVFARYVLTPSNTGIVSDINRVTARFNSSFIGKQLILINEAMDTGNRAGNQIMKNRVTEDEQMVERKGQEAFYVRDFCNYMIATNNDFSSIVEANDRRYLCLEVSDKVCAGMPGANQYWDRIYDRLLTVEAGKHIFHWLLRRDLSDFKIQNIPETAYKKELKLKQSGVGVRYLLHKREQFIERGDDEIHPMTHAEMYADYRQWLETSCETSVGSQAFGTMINALGFKLAARSIDPVTKRRSSVGMRKISRSLIEERLAQYIVELDAED